MFGLEKETSSNTATVNTNTSKEVIYDIESEWTDAVKVQSYQERINGRIQEIKNALRQGTEKTLFEKSGTLLHGYLAFLRVMQRNLYMNKSSELAKKK